MVEKLFTDMSRALVALFLSFAQPPIPQPPQDKREAVVEKLFTDVYASLGRVEEALGQTKGEIYVWHFWGRYFFLPGGWAAAGWANGGARGRGGGGGSKWDAQGATGPTGTCR